MRVEHRLPDEAALALALARDVAARLREAIGQRGCAMLAVSGGRSPIPFLQALSDEPLQWTAVTVILVDERCVPHGHAESNTTLVQRHLLQGRAANAGFVPFFEHVPAVIDEVALNALQQQAEIRLARLAWPIDAAVLGMGLDGHTASLFPGAPGMAHALTTSAHCAWVRPVDAAHPRLTLTLATLLQARHLALQLSGDAKRAVYARALQGADPRLPISLVLCREAPPIAVWIGA